MFFQLSGAYAFGLCSDALPPLSPAWWGSLLLGLSPLLSLLARGHPYVMGEAWPATNCALFPWSAAQLDFILKFRTGKTRLVLTAQPYDDSELVGRPVTQRGQKCPPDRGAIAVHDALGNIWNWTKVYPPFVRALNAVLEECTDHDLAAVEIVHKLQDWLQADQPILQTQNNRPLLYCHLVEIHPETKLITRVIKQCTRLYRGKPDPWPQTPAKALKGRPKIRIWSPF